MKVVGLYQSGIRSHQTELSLGAIELPVDRRQRDVLSGIHCQYLPRDAAWTGEDIPAFKARMMFTEANDACFHMK